MKRYKQLTLCKIDIFVMRAAMKKPQLKSLLLVLLLGLSLPAWAGLRDMVELRTKNYVTLSGHYEQLLKSLHGENAKLFCSLVDEIFPVLSQILEDDNKFVKELIRTWSEDHSRYAEHIKDNSSSPLLSYYSRRNACRNNDLGSLSDLIKYVNNDIINVSYLSSAHRLWQEAYGPF